MKRMLTNSQKEIEITYLNIHHTKLKNNVLKFTIAIDDSVASQNVTVAYALTVVSKIGIATRNAAVVSNESRWTC